MPPFLRHFAIQLQLGGIRIMATLAELEARLSSLDKLIREIVSSLEASERKRYRDEAEKLAISEMLIVLAVRAGLSREEFVSMFTKQIAESHDAILRNLEDTDPAIAALLDDRKIEEITPDENNELP
jgi:hypothetical protein